MWASVLPAIAALCQGTCINHKAGKRSLRGCAHLLCVLTGGVELAACGVQGGVDLQRQYEI